MTDIGHPTETDPHLYRVVFENDKVRVVEYRDTPGARTRRHRHPGSVMITLSAFRRRMIWGDKSLDVDRLPFEASWLPEQTHIGENIGETGTHMLFVEIK
ncbi:MAG: cytoplasmic protein [Streptomyces sp.]|nr:cytoplasmic protein [Streptomyces sp.]NUS15531.1 cytoplasmic protein [Streptomyces sp.]